MMHEESELPQIETGTRVVQLDSVVTLVYRRTNFSPAELEHSLTPFLCIH